MSSSTTAIDKPKGLSPPPNDKPEGLSPPPLRAKAEGLSPQPGCDHCEVDAPKPTGARARAIATAAAGGLVAAGCALDLLATGPSWVTPAFMAAALVGSVFPAERALASIRRGLLDINALMVIAVAGALLIDQVEEAAMVVLLFSLAQWLEVQTLDRARRAIARLLDLAPPRVLLRHDDGDKWVGIDEVRLGAVMIVRPGDKVALDGVVRAGSSDVNQAPITGESLPVEKSPETSSMPAP